MPPRCAALPCLLAALATVSAKAQDQTSPGVLYLSNGAPAFVEIVTPSGFGICNGVVPTPSCTEAGGNSILNAFNGDGTYIFSTLGGEGTVATLGVFAPHDVEIRFTAEGSYAVYPFVGDVVEMTAVRVPFEVWDVGSEPPFSPRDPSDDVQLIPVLHADGDGTCAFDYGEAEVFNRPASDGIYAYYPRDSDEDGDVDNDDYAAFSAEAEALLPSEDACARGEPVRNGPYAFIDFERSRVIQRQVFVDNTGTSDVGTLQGAILKFYTTAPPPPADEEDPEEELVLVPPFPNPTRGDLRIRFQATPGTFRLRVLDALGREVLGLNEELQETRIQERLLGTSTLAPGVYVLQLQLPEGRRKIHRVTVIR